MGAAARGRSERGVVLLALLVTLALIGVALLAGTEVAVTARERQREQELLFIGDQYRQAIERYYYAAPPGTPRVLPASVEQLLLDDRYPQAVQHLRRAYVDPYDPAADWTWIRIGGRLAGIHSTSQAVPLKRANFKPRYASFANATDVSQWVFLFTPPSPLVAPSRPANTNTKR